MIEKNIYYVQFAPLGSKKIGVAVVAANTTDVIEKLLLENSDFKNEGKLEITMILELPSSHYCGNEDVIFIEDLFNDPGYD